MPVPFSVDIQETSHCGKWFVSLKLHLRYTVIKICTTTHIYTVLKFHSNKKTQN